MAIDIFEDIHRFMYHLTDIKSKKLTISELKICGKFAWFQCLWYWAPLCLHINEMRTYRRFISLCNERLVVRCTYFTIRHKTFTIGACTINCNRVDQTKKNMLSFSHAHQYIAKELMPWLQASDIAFERSVVRSQQYVNKKIVKLVSK